MTLRAFAANVAAAFRRSDLRADIEELKRNRRRIDEAITDLSSRIEAHERHHAPRRASRPHPDRERARRTDRFTAASEQNQRVDRASEGE